MLSIIWTSPTDWQSILAHALYCELMLQRRRRNGLPRTGYMVAMCAMVLPILKKKLEIAELMLEHGAGTCFNGTAYNGTECSGTACNQLSCATAV